jgi:hypothetical protein
MTKEAPCRLDVEEHGALLIARLDGGPLAQLGPDLASALTALVARVESDPATATRARSVATRSRGPRVAR